VQICTIHFELCRWAQLAFEVCTSAQLTTISCPHLHNSFADVCNSCLNCADAQLIAEVCKLTQISCAHLHNSRTSCAYLRNSNFELSLGLQQTAPNKLYATGNELIATHTITQKQLIICKCNRNFVHLIHNSASHIQPEAATSSSTAC